MRGYFWRSMENGTEINGLWCKVHACFFAPLYISHELSEAPACNWQQEGKLVKLNLALSHFHQSQYSPLNWVDVVFRELKYYTDWCWNEEKHSGAFLQILKVSTFWKNILHLWHVVFIVTGTYSSCRNVTLADFLRRYFEVILAILTSFVLT